MDLYNTTFLLAFQLTDLLLPFFFFNWSSPHPTPHPFFFFEWLIFHSTSSANLSSTPSSTLLLQLTLLLLLLRLTGFLLMLLLLPFFFLFFNWRFSFSLFFFNCPFYFFFLFSLNPIRTPTRTNAKQNPCKKKRKKDSSHQTIKANTTRHCRGPSWSRHISARRMLKTGTVGAVGT